MKRSFLVVLAVLLPLLPLAVWLNDIWSDFGAPLGVSFYLLYIPARAFGLLGFVLMFYQFILASRIPALDAILPRAQQLKTHRTLGKIGGVMILSHGLFMLLFDVITLGAIGWTVGKLLGIIALFLLINAVIAAWFIRPLQLSQPTWRKIHLLAYAVFPLAFVHAIMIGSTVRGYAAVRWLFILLLAIYVVLAVRRVVANPFAKKSAPKKSKPLGDGA